ncbi:MAG: type II toxin-antitoxin system Phd/YefM family antitoxin [Alphaproteobacteria bacterium]
MTTVTASKLQKNFGQYKEEAQRAPVMVTSNGRESVVLMSSANYKEYLELKANRYAHKGAVSTGFKNDVDGFMDEHEGVFDGLAK